MIDYRCNLLGKQGRNGVSNLCVLLRPVAFKKVVIRESLKSRSFSNRESAALERIGMNEIVPVL